MDFQFTSRPSANIKPVWVENRDESHTPQKRTRLFVRTTTCASFTCIV